MSAARVGLDSSGSGAMGVDLREAAISYAQRGWSVFPLKPGTKRPDHNLVPQGYLEASDWPPDALYWWERSPDANVGIACHASGLVVIDVDERAGGFDTIYEFEQKYGPAPETERSLTGSGGLHILLEHPGVPLKGQLGPGVDIKDFGYIVAPPSRHPNGNYYEWEDEGAIVAQAPEAWISVLEVPQRPPRSSLSPSDDPLLQIPAEDYVERLTGREVCNGWAQCPFHADGNERTPSLKVNGAMWACFGSCEPLAGKQVMGGNLLDLAGMLKHYGLPLRGTDLQIVKSEMERLFLGTTTPAA